MHLESLPGMGSRTGQELSSPLMFEKVSHSLVDPAVTGLPSPRWCAGYPRLLIADNRARLEKYKMHRRLFEGWNSRLEKRGRKVCMDCPS